MHFRFVFFLWIRIKNAASLAFWLAALFVPAIIFTAGLLFGGGDMAIHVGVYGDLKNLPSTEDWVLHRYQDREQLRRDVASMRLELGYAFDSGGVTLYTSPATVSERVTNLLMASAILESRAGEVGARSLPIAADAAEIQAMADAYLADGPLMQRIVLVYGDNEQAAEHIPFRRLFHGLLALFAQLVAMLAAMRFANTNENRVLKRIRQAGSAAAVSYVQAGYWAVFAMTAIVMFTAGAAGASAFPGIWTPADAPAALIYLLVVCAIAYTLAMVLPQSLYPPVLIVGFIFTALMGGVLFDLREVFEAAGFLRLFFPSYYYMASVL